MGSSERINADKGRYISFVEVVAQWGVGSRSACVRCGALKGIPGSYGGYETFVDRLTEYHEGEPGLRYHVACKSLSESGEFSYHNARCFRVRVPQIGPAQAIWYDVAALADCVAYIRRNRIPHPIVYVLACRIGPFTAHFARAVHRLGGKLYVNPDGTEGCARSGARRCAGTGRCPSGR